MAMLTLEEAAARLGITPDELRSKAKTGSIRALRDGGNLLFKEEEIAKHAPAPSENPMKPDFVLEFDSPETSESEPIKSDILATPQDSDDSFEFTLPGEGLQATQAAPDDSAEFQLEMPADPGSSDILNIPPSPSEGDSSSDFVLEVSPQSDTGSSGEFIAAVSSEIQEGAAEDATMEGDLFELSDSATDQTIAYTPNADDSSSEFDLGLSPEDGQTDGTGSEFDLTLEPEGMAPSDSAVFETDFTGVGESDSSSEVMAIDGLDSSLEGSADGTGSEVVPVDELADDAAATVQPGDDLLIDDNFGEEAEIQEIGGDGEPIEVDADPEQRTSVTPAVDAPWGAFPASVLLITVPLLFFVALISVEMLRSVWAYNRGYAATRPLIRAEIDLVGVKIND
jgi:excisionase family DNA binding protein